MDPSVLLDGLSVEPRRDTGGLHDCQGRNPPEAITTLVRLRYVYRTERPMRTKLSEHGREAAGKNSNLV